MRSEWLAMLVVACGPSGVVREASLPDTGIALTDDGEALAPPADDTDLADTSPALDSDRPVDSEGSSGPCPADMVEVDGSFCIDVAEAALARRVGGALQPVSPYSTPSGADLVAVSGLGRVPQAHISQQVAAAACSAADKRLCTSAEWLAACRGPDERLYPYGDAYQPGACNDTYPGGHPVVDLFGTNVGVWDAASMNDPRLNQQPDTVEAGGAHPACTSAWGTVDQHGNLHEWVADASGVFRGGFYGDAEINGTGCGYVTTAHGPAYHDYSTGFRCCADRDDEADAALP